MPKQSKAAKSKTLSLLQVATTLSVSMSTVRRLVARGDLPVVYEGRSPMVSERVLDSFIKKAGPSTRRRAA
jgi:excisionase family DNA binding protein